MKALLLSLVFFAAVVQADDYAERRERLVTEVVLYSRLAGDTTGSGLDQRLCLARFTQS